MESPLECFPVPLRGTPGILGILNCCLASWLQPQSEMCMKGHNYFIRRDEPQHLAAELRAHEQAHASVSLSPRITSEWYSPTLLEGWTPEAMHGGELELIYLVPFGLHKLPLLSSQRGDVPSPKSQNLVVGLQKKKSPSTAT